MADAPSFADQASAQVARLLFSLPRPVVKRLAGPLPRVDGPPLDPYCQLAVHAQRLSGRPPWNAIGANRARAEYRLMRQATELAPPPLAAVEDGAVPGPAGSIPVRAYRPRLAGGPLPLLVYLHGGGFTIGDLESHDTACRRLAHAAGCVVVAVDYRLAPEHPFPAAIEDSLAAFRHVAAHATDFGGDPGRVALGGDSAGGNLSAVVGQLTRGEAHAPRFTALVYPATDHITDHPSRSLFDEGFLLDRPLRDWFWDQYAGGEDWSDPRLSPLLAEDLEGHPETLLFTAGFDPLRDEGLAYADALARVGVRVERHHHPRLTHGWITMSRLPGARDAFADLASALRRAFRRAG